MIYEIYSSDPKKGLVSVAPHARDTSDLDIANLAVKRLLQSGRHVIVRKFDNNQSKQYSISYTVNSKALRDLEKMDLTD